MRRHLASTGVGVVGRRDGGQELLRRRHAEPETQGTIAIVGIEPIVAGAKDLRGGNQDRFMPCA